MTDLDLVHTINALSAEEERLTPRPVTASA